MLGLRLLGLKESSRVMVKKHFSFFLVVRQGGILLDSNPSKVGVRYRIRIDYGFFMPRLLKVKVRYRVRIEISLFMLNSFAFK